MIFASSLQRESDFSNLTISNAARREETSLMLLVADIEEASPDAKAVNDTLCVLVNVASIRVRSVRRAKRD